MKFSKFLRFFPSIELPVTLTEDSVRHFSAENKPFPESVLKSYISDYEAIVIDEFTEFIPCLQIKKLDDIHLIIYWKGSLLNYEYVLVSLEKSGKLICRNVIAGTKTDGDQIIRSAATIDEDLTINIMVGASVDGHTYDPAHSRAMNMEVLSSGDVVFATDNVSDN